MNRPPPNTTSTLLAYGFRPFFLLTGIYACLAVVGWMGFVLGGWPLPLGWSPLKWHSHEMLYGLVAAAIAGFLLTAITNWTNTPPVRGGKLLALVLLWLAGRVVMWLAGWLPSWLVALVDLSFLPVLGVYLLAVLWRYGNTRNLILVAVLALLTLGNLLMHLGFINIAPGLLQAGERLGFNVIVLMIVVIAGRITPAFSANWLRQQGGNPEWVVRSLWTDRLAIASVALLIPLDLLDVPTAALGTATLAAAALNGLRLWQWAGWRTAKEPLLWILHFAYLWLVLALLLRAGAHWDLGFSSSLWQHTLGVGGIGILLLGVMTRVSMGHTGRPLKLVRFGVWIYIAIIGSAVMRTLGAARVIDYQWGLISAAALWVLAFGLFVILYWPILSTPRVDGRPG